MRFTAAIIPLALLPLSVLARRPRASVAEYYSLGCPSSTKPYASLEEQLEAITDYGDLLYLQKKVDTAEATYVAKDFINHAPESVAPL